MTARILALALLLSLPASAREVEVKTDSGILKGTLEEVEGNPDYVIFIHPGSGTIDRNGNDPMGGMPNHLKLFAEELKKEGIASLRIDKRGHAASSSAALKQEELRFDTFIEDTATWIRFLETHGYQKIILLGHGEGALITMIAAQKSKVNAYISASGNALPIDEQLLEGMNRKAAVDPVLVEQTQAFFAQLKAGKTATPPQRLASLFPPSIQPYLISQLRYDPSKEITKLGIPILILHGSEDREISARNANKLHSCAPDSKLVVIEGMNHRLKDIRGTKAPKLPLSKQLTKEIIRFINELE